MNEKEALRMDLRIEPLCPARAGDYFDFFDNRAFTDGSPYYPCYCAAFNMTAERIQAEFYDEAAAAGGGPQALNDAMRRTARGMVDRGEIQGYLAYDGPLAVGWCNANDRASYARVGEFDLEDVPGENDLPPVSGRIRSVVCFEIAPDYRGRGIAAALLDRVCADAAADGYDAVEAYPILRRDREPLDFTGPLRLYEKAGFRPVERRGRMLVMRKML